MNLLKFSSNPRIESLYCLSTVSGHYVHLILVLFTCLFRFLYSFYRRIDVRLRRLISITYLLTDLLT